MAGEAAGFAPRRFGAEPQRALSRLAAWLASVVRRAGRTKARVEDSETRSSRRDTVPWWVEHYESIVSATVLTISARRAPDDGPAEAGSARTRATGIGAGRIRLSETSNRSMEDFEWQTIS